MKKNIGTADRIARVLIALVIGLLYFTHVISGTLGMVLLAVGAIFLVTALINFCPIYFSIGVNTMGKNK